MNDEIEGKYAYSDGYSGESISIHDGRYEMCYFSCTGQGIVSSGDYKLESGDLVLVDPKRGIEYRFSVREGHLIAKHDGYTTDFVKHEDAEGKEIPGAIVYQNSFLEPPGN